MATCLERKFTLDGGSQQYLCELLLLEPRFGVLRYVLDRSYTIAGTRLRPSDITYALYWEDRPYTLYVWHTGAPRRSYYFNIADSIALSSDLFSWRDLAVDILIDAHRSVHVLDEHEIPPETALHLLSRIESSKDLVLASWPRIVREADALLAPWIIPQP